MTHDLALSLACAAASAFHASGMIDTSSGVAADVAGQHHVAPHIFSSFLDTAKPDGHVWTFAYGANIGSPKLIAAGILPKVTLPATLPKHALVFDRDIGVSGQGRGVFAREEQAFANVRKVASPTEVAPVEGVVHEITPAELDILDKSEAPIMHRELMNVQVTKKNSSFAVPAWTYVSKDYDNSQASDIKVGIQHESAPSERYGRLVVCGAEERTLPKAYIAKLRHHLQELGLTPESLDCSKPLQPLIGQEKHSHGEAVQLSETGNGMISMPTTGMRGRSNPEAMDSFLFPKTPVIEHR